MTGPVRDTIAMIAGMRPERMEGSWVFVSVAEGHPAAARLRAAALATLREAEGLSLIVPVALARAEGLPDAPAMAHLVLMVHSALDGVGLTAAVSTALAEAGIACNVVAGHHHDHVFVPLAQAEEARAILEARAARAAASGKASGAGGCGVGGSDAGASGAGGTGAGGVA